MYLKYTALLFALMINYVENRDSVCVDVPKVPNFDVMKLVGTWYPYLMSNDIETARSCIAYTIFPKNLINNVIAVKRTWTQNYDYFMMTQKGNISEFEVDWLGKNRTVNVVATDYKTYAVWYCCYPEDHSKSLLSLATRDIKRDDDLLKKAAEAVKNVDFKGLRNKLIPNQHGDCDKV